MFIAGDMKIHAAIAGAFFVIEALIIGSVIIAAAILAVGVPFMFINSLKARKDRKALKLWLFRLSVYSVSALLILASFTFNSAKSDEKAYLIVKGCQQYKTDNGHYPEKLKDLVPGYLDKVMKARHTLLFSEFSYGPEGSPMLSYVDFPPFSRRVYDFQKSSWISID